MRPGPKPKYQTDNSGAQALGEMLRRRDLSQRRAAEILGVTHGYLNRLVHGYVRPGRAVAVRIQEELGVPVSSWD